jgi:hypothetical protein
MPSTFTALILDSGSMLVYIFIPSLSELNFQSVCALAGLNDHTASIRINSRVFILLSVIFCEDKVIAYTVGQFHPNVTLVNRLINNDNLVNIGELGG